MTGTTPGGPPSTGATVTKVADEFAAVVGPLRGLVRARSAELVAGLAVLLTALALFAVAGSALDDRTLTADRAVAQAEVLDGSTFMRTLVRFTTEKNETVVPESGVAYPRGLQVGQTVTVEYEKSDPDRVRVAGRSALNQSGPLALGVLVTWVLLGPTAYWLLRRRRAAS